MKATTILGSLLLSVALCSPSFGCVELLGRLLGLENCDDCGCAACAPCQSCCNACQAGKGLRPEAPCCGSRCARNLAACRPSAKRRAVERPSARAVLWTGCCRKPCCAPAGCEAGCEAGCCCKLRCKVREVLCNIRDLFQCKRCCCDCGAAAAAAAVARHAAGKAAMPQLPAAALLLHLLRPRRPAADGSPAPARARARSHAHSAGAGPVKTTSPKVDLALGCRPLPGSPFFFLAAYRRYTLPGGWAITSDFSPSGRTSCMPGVR